MDKTVDRPIDELYWDMHGLMWPSDGPVTPWLEMQQLRCQHEHEQLRERRRYQINREVPTWLPRSAQPIWHGKKEKAA